MIVLGGLLILGLLVLIIAKLICMLLVRLMLMLFILMYMYFYVKKHAQLSQLPVAWVVPGYKASV